MQKELVENWAPLLNSVELSRDRNARYFKPTCLLAVCSLIDKGADPACPIPVWQIISEFDALVVPIAPKKADRGWMPLWHLRSDGAWTCTKAGVSVSREVFSLGKPRTLHQLISEVDTIELISEAIPLWLNKDSRDELKAALCTIMKVDRDETTQRMGRYLEVVLSAQCDAPEFQEFDWVGSGMCFVEDYTKYRRHVRVERDANVIKAAKSLLGYQCAACGFDYQKAYGKLGQNYIELHHVSPVAENKGLKKAVSVTDDFEVLCANCHRMIHRLGPPWSKQKVGELQGILRLHGCVTSHDAE